MLGERRGQNYCDYIDRLAHTHSGSKCGELVSHSMDIGEYFGGGGATGSACGTSSGALHSTSMDSTVDLSLDSLVILDGSTGKLALDAISGSRSV